jgi:fumarylacetoacetase
VRNFLDDGDQITFRAYAQKPGLPRIGLGECAGTMLSPYLPHIHTGS